MRLNCVIRGREGERNIKVENVRRPCGVRRHKWNTIGPATASSPARYRGASQLKSGVLRNSTVFGSST
jgi:hypothetical protein